MQQHEPPGQLGTPLPFADCNLNRDHDHQRPRHPRHDLWRANDACKDEQEGCEHDHEGGCNAHVQVGRVEQVPEPWHVVASGVRTGHRHDCARDNDDPCPHGQHNATSRQPPWGCWGPVGGDLERFERQHHENHELDEGHYKVAHDGDRVQIKQDRQSTEWALHKGQDADRERATEEPF